MADTDALQRIGAGSLWIGAGFVAGSVLEYGVKVVLARFLGPESYGVFTQGLAVAQVTAVIALLGLHRGMPRFVSYYKGLDAPGHVAAAIRTSFLLGTGGGIVASIGLFAAAPVIATVFEEPALVGPLRLFAAAILPLGLYYLTIAVLRGRQNARDKVLLSDVGLPVVEIVLLAVLLSLGYGVTGAVTAYLLAVIAAAGVGLLLARRAISQPIRSAGFVPRELVTFCWPLLVVSIALVINKWIDVLMLGWLTESADVGVYEVSLSIAGFTNIFLVSVNYMFMPVASELWAEDRGDAIKDTYRTTTRWVVTGLLPLVTILLLYPGELLQLLFGSAYAAGATAMSVLTVGYGFGTAVGPAGMALIAVDRTKRFMTAMIILGLADILLNLLLIPRYGIVGAAIGMTAGVIVANLLLLVFLRRNLGFQPYSRAYLPAVGAAIGASSIGIGLQSVSIPHWAVSAVAVGAVYLVLLYALGGIREAERTFLRGLVSGD